MAVVVVSMISCDRVKPAYNRENLKATWVADKYDGVVVDPYRWTVQNFSDKGALTIFGVRDVGDGNRTWGSCSMSYEAYCCDVSYVGIIQGFMGIPISAELSREYAFASSQDSLVTLDLISEKVNGEDVYSDHNRLTMRKLVKTYASTDSLVGIWQTSTRDAEKFESWRLMFESGNVFSLSVQTPGGSWMQIGDGTDQYAVYTDFITLTIKDNPYLGTEGYTDVAIFTNVTARPKASFMLFNFEGHTYTFTYVSSLN